MPNFYQISSEMTILGHLMKLTNQLTTQPLFIIKISLVHHFFKSESIWNIHDKFLPNPLEMTFQRIYPVIGIALTDYFSNVLKFLLIRNIPKYIYIQVILCLIIRMDYLTKLLRL